MNIHLKELKEQDLALVQEIYNHYVLHSTVTFQKDLVSLEKLKNEIPVGHPKYKSFLIESEDKICGYCYLSQYKNRQAYDRTAEVTLYLKPGFEGKGIGKQTLPKLEAVAINHQIKVLIAIITEENLPSVKLFENAAYEKCAHFKKVGEKFGSLLDVVAYQKILQD
jgi:phosphinothricin acetyltransferase